MDRDRIWTLSDNAAIFCILSLTIAPESNMAIARKASFTPRSPGRFRRTILVHSSIARRPNRNGRNACSANVMNSYFPCAACA